MKNKKDIRLSLYGIALILLPKEGTRVVVESKLLQFYCIYAQEASKKLPGFGLLFDLYAPAVISDFDNAHNNIDILISEVHSLLYKYRHNENIRKELRYIKLLLSKAKKMVSYLIVISPYPAESSDFDEAMLIE